MTIKRYMLALFLSLNVMLAGTSEDSLFWSSAHNIDFGGLDSLSFDQEHHGFVKGLESVVRGDFASAESVFTVLYSNANDSLIKTSASDILGCVLLANSRWDALLQLGVGEKQSGIDPLIRAYRTLAKERVVYSSSEEILPIGISMSGTPLVQVEINGHTRVFWLDTGAGMTAIASDVAEDCGILPLSTDSAHALTATTKRVAVQPAIIDSFSIGGFVITNHPAIIISSRDLEFRLLGIPIMKIDGLIGWNAIKSMDLEIDYARKTILIREPLKDSGTVRNFFWLGVPVAVLASPDGTALNFLLDTGANRTSVFDNIFTKLIFKKIYQRTRLVGSVGGFVRLILKRIPLLELFVDGQQVQLRNVTTLPSPGVGFVSLDGILGSDALRDKLVRIDPANGRLELESSSYKNSREENQDFLNR